MLTIPQYTGSYTSPLGGITMASDGERLTGLWFDGQKYFGATLPPNPISKELPVFAETRRWLDGYFRGASPAPLPSLRLCGSPFRLAVWALLQKIPRGQVITYGEIARVLAAETGRSSMSAQAVGGAVGHNPISILVPCHRVVGTDGSLTGYAGGMERKQALLLLENADFSRLSRPGLVPTE